MRATTLAKQFPDYLKLHREEPAECQAPGWNELPGLKALQRGFEQTTGWRLRWTGDAEPAAGDAYSQLIDDGSERPLGHMVVESFRDDKAPTAALPIESVRPLADSLSQVISELARTQRVVWQREAELAAGVPVSSRPDEARHLAERLESVLRAGAESIRCQAAALYLLDEATSQLKMRSCWGLPKTRLLEAARPLRGAVADLEALLGHAVVLENSALLPHWKSPEPYPAAVCVPVSSPSIPLGTLWFFSDAAREFSEHETQMAEVIAGRLAADLEREMLLTEGLRIKRLDEQIDTITKWQRSRLPTVKPLIDGWQIAGTSDSGDAARRQFHDWFVLPSGVLAMTVGKSEGESLAATLNAAAVHAALKAHSAHQRDTGRVLNCLNETIWTSGSGDQFASLCYALLHPERSTLEWSSAGDVRAILVRGRAFKSLASNAPLLGSDPDAFYNRQRTRLRRGDTLAIFTTHLGATSEDDSTLAQRIRASLRLSIDELAESLRESLPTHEATGERTLLVLRRR